MAISHYATVIARCDHPECEEEIHIEINKKQGLFSKIWEPSQVDQKLLEREWYSQWDGPVYCSTHRKEMAKMYQNFLETNQIDYTIPKEERDAQAESSEIITDSTDVVESEEKQQYHHTGTTAEQSIPGVISYEQNRQSQLDECAKQLCSARTIMIALWDLISDENWNNLPYQLQQDLYEHVKSHKGYRQKDKERTCRELQNAIQAGETIIAQIKHEGKEPTQDLIDHLNRLQIKLTMVQQSDPLNTTLY